MFKNAILRYKWHALTSVVLTSIVVITTLLQPSYLKDVLTAVLLNDQDEIFRVGKILLVIAGIGLLAGLANTIIAAKLPKEYLRIFEKIPSEKFKVFHMQISKSLMLVI